jgi:hypothetical protein
VGTSALAITPVAIDTVPNVRVKPRRLDTSRQSELYQYPIFMWFYLPDSIINVLAMQDPRLVYDLL